MIGKMVACAGKNILSFWHSKSSER